MYICGLRVYACILQGMYVYMYVCMRVYYCVIACIMKLLSHNVILTVHKFLSNLLKLRYHIELLRKSLYCSTEMCIAILCKFLW